ncbi:MAG: hypothetical protein Q9159_000007 [Coniocarpon cinnabarinum]
MASRSSTSAMSSTSSTSFVNDINDSASVSTRSSSSSWKNRSVRLRKVGLKALPNTTFAAKQTKAPKQVLNEVF